MLQFVDTWTNNFAYVGHRATGSRAGSFLLVPPGRSDHPSDGTVVIRSRTAVATIVGRWAVNGPDDLPAVKALQDGLTLSPTTDRASRGLPEPDLGVAEDIAFFEQLRVWLQAFPPAPRDMDYQARFEPLGLFERANWLPTPDGDFGPLLRMYEPRRVHLRREIRTSANHTTPVNRRSDHRAGAVLAPPDPFPRAAPTGFEPVSLP